MTSNAERYRDLTRRLFAARAQNSEELEDSLLDQMDGVWRAMTEVERSEAERWNAETLAGQSERTK